MSLEPPRTSATERDRVREYDNVSRDKLSANLGALLTAIDQGAFSERPLDTRLFCEFHRTLFDGVRDHAGHHRDRGVGQEHLIYFERRSPHRNEVRALLDVAFEAARKDLPNNAPVESVVRGCVKLHVELTRIQAFEDGNKRTGRALVDEILRRQGLGALDWHVPRPEYIEALESGLDGNLRPMEDLVIRLLSE